MRTNFEKLTLTSSLSDHSADLDLISSFVKLIIFTKLVQVKRWFELFFFFKTL